MPKVKLAELQVHFKNIKIRIVEAKCANRTEGVVTRGVIAQLKTVENVNKKSVDS